MISWWTEAGRSKASVHRYLSTYRSDTERYLLRRHTSSLTEGWSSSEFWLTTVPAVVPGHSSCLLAGLCWWYRTRVWITRPSYAQSWRIEPKDLTVTHKHSASGQHRLEFGYKLSNFLWQSVSVPLLRYSQHLPTSPSPPAMSCMSQLLNYCIKWMGLCTKNEVKKKSLEGFLTFI